jgi:hypothetical protein
MYCGKIIYCVFILTDSDWQWRFYLCIVGCWIGSVASELSWAYRRCYGLRFSTIRDWKHICIGGKNCIAFENPSLLQVPFDKLLLTVFVFSRVVIEWFWFGTWELVSVCSHLKAISLTLTVSSFILVVMQWPQDQMIQQLVFDLYSERLYYASCIVRCKQTGQGLNFVVQCENLQFCLFRRLSRCLFLHTR